MWGSAVWRRARRFRDDEAGANLLEYAFLAALIGLAAAVVASDYLLGLDGMLSIVAQRINAFVS